MLRAVPAAQVFLTATHLVLVMEYAAGGDLAHYVAAKQGLTEGEARWFFQQLIVALDYCHRMVGAGGSLLLAAPWLLHGCACPNGDRSCRHRAQAGMAVAAGRARVAVARPCASITADCPCLQGVSSRDIKLQNILLDGSPQPLIKVWACEMWQLTPMSRR